MKYESGENFKSMAYRYCMIMNLLNYNDLKVPTPKLNDGQLIDIIRNSAYSEATERLLILFSYGMIDEAMLRFLALGKKIRCEDVTEAENFVLKLESEETAKEEKYVELNADMLDLNAFHNALKMCAESTNSEILAEVSFNTAYEICSAKHKHITIEEGFCIPDDYLHNYALCFDGLFAIFSMSKKEVEEISDSFETGQGERIVFKDVRAAAFIEYYIEKLFGRDYITYCIENELPMEISEEKYREYLNDKKLSFEFKKLTRKHCYFTSRYNHLDYSIIKTENGEFISKNEAPAEVLTLRIDAAEVSLDDTPREIVVKLLKKNANTFPDEGTIMQTSYDNEIMIFAYSKGVYKEIDYKQFISNIVDYKRILSLANFFSKKHLIRLSGDNNVEIIASQGGVNYIQENNITNDEFEAIKGVVREQLARRFALERKKTEGLRTMSQLKVEAESAKREEAEAKAKAEEEKQQKKEEEKAKREGRKKSGEE